ncbi:hypothetical protein WCP94_001849 [Bilophila wadsworthia]
MPFKAWKPFSMCARGKAGPLMVENKALRCNARGDMAGTYCVTAAGRVQCRDFS